MLDVVIDEDAVNELISKRVTELVKIAEDQVLFWDSAELKKQTSMCWGTIQKSFFFDPRMPKHKVGRDWYFPAKKTKEFLETWLSEQGR